MPIGRMIFRVFMNKFFCYLLLILFCLAKTAPAQPEKTKGRSLVERSIAAMGGSAKLSAIKSLHTRSAGHFYLLEQSERPDGPWFSVNQTTEEWRDSEHGSIRRTYEQSGVYTGKTTEIVAGGISVSDTGNGFSPNPGNLPPTEELLAMAPERALLNAMAASDLRYAGEETIQGSLNDVIGFTWRGSNVRIYLNRYTGLLTLTDVVKARPTELFWSIWGDFSERNYYSFWNLEKGGIHYPRQVDTYYNGQLFRTDTIVSLEFNEPAPADTYAIADDVKAAYASFKAPSFPDLPLGRPDRPPIEVANDFTIIRGNWNVTLVKQSDGIVVVEAPISSSYSVKVLDEVERRYPGAKIKAVISTSDAFPHFGGLRQYVAEGIPVYILDLNRPIVERLLSAKYATNPDDLEKNPKRKRTRLNIVAGKTVIGSGPNELDLFPIRTESGERMIMIFASKLKLIYGADLVQPLPGGGFFMPQYISELRDAVLREGLDVEKVFAIHSAPLEWSKVLDAMKEIEK